jgi:hypothetical protein
MNNELKAVEVMAISKAIKTAQVSSARKNLTVGTHEVNCLVRVKGSIKVGEDGTTNSWTKAKYDLLAGIALSHVNEATLKAIIREYVEIVKDNDSAEDKAIASAKEIKSEADKALKEVLGSTEVFRSGTVTTKLEIEAVEELAEV